MNECLICYDHKADQGRMVFLECLHTVCKICLTKLQKDACPFCRSQINRKSHLEKINQKTKVIQTEYYRENISAEMPIRVRTRRRRRRTITERVDTEHGIVILETGILRDKKPKKRRKSKHNKRKNNWARGQARNFAKKCKK